MGKTLLAIILIAAAGYFIYVRTHGAPSEEEAMVASIRDRYAVAVEKITSAQGRAGLRGIDSAAESDQGVVQIQRLRTELAELINKLTEDKAIRKAYELSEKIEYFCKQNNILRP